MEYHCLADELIDRCTAHNMAELQAEYHIEAVEQLVRDLERHGDSKRSLLVWLGHPLSEMTPEEYEILTDYLGRMDEARAKGDETKHIHPRRKSQGPV